MYSSANNNFSVSFTVAGQLVAVYLQAAVKVFAYAASDAKICSVIDLATMVALMRRRLPLFALVSY
jgi:hypothetical protein